jgi:membrane protein implicated in regulation of membrane protease activity
MHQLFDLYRAEPFWTWAAVAAALLAIEIVSGSGWLLWAAAAAGVTAAVTLVPAVHFPHAVLVFALLTIVSTLLARRYVPRSTGAHGHDINDNVARLVGHHGATVAPFSHGAGRVFIDGKEWAAELEEEAALEAGAAVTVTGVHGARLKVRRA